MESRVRRQSHGFLKARADQRSLGGLSAYHDHRFLCGRPGKTDHPAAAQRGELVNVVESAGAHDFIAPFGRPVIRLVVGVAVLLQHSCAILVSRPGEAVDGIVAERHLNGVGRAEGLGPGVDGSIHLVAVIEARVERAGVATALIRDQGLEFFIEAAIA
jgi:hypothetical protein